MIALSRGTLSLRPAAAVQRPVMRRAAPAAPVRGLGRATVLALPARARPAASRPRSVSVSAAAGDGGGPSGPLTVIPTDYRIGATLLAVALFLGPVCHLWTQFLLHGALGGFLSFQASRLRFRFSETDLDLVFIEPLGDDSQALTADAASSGDNKLQGGGLNKWSLKSVTNWEFWWPGFPVLVYFKETQTRPEGQPHFFPIILNGKRLYEEMLAKMPPSVNAKPSPADWNLDTALEATPVGAGSPPASPFSPESPPRSPVRCRLIKEKLEPDARAKLKDIKGLPIVDDPK